MILLTCDWDGPSWADPDRAVRSLGLFSPAAVRSERTGSRCYADKRIDAASPPARPRPRPGQARGPGSGWRAPRSPGGAAVLLEGWIDNLAELAAELGVSGSPERIYGAAVERWGDRADARVIGEYAAIVDPGNGPIRLARSPWGGFPLFYANDSAALVVGSVPRLLFAAGRDKRLRPSAVERLLAFEVPDGRHAMFEGIEMVPAGTVVHCHRGGEQRTAWYDPDAIPRVRLASDADYVEAANEQLARAAKAALAMARKPAIGLSGGLDSSIVADELLRHLPAGERLAAITFVPLAEWDGISNPWFFPSDRPYVEAFARQHPALDVTFVDNRGIDFLDRSEQVFLAGDAGYGAMVMGSVHNGVADEARRQGCDVLLGAGMGNATFSTEAPWAPAEFFRTGRWRQLWKLAAARRMDPRPMWRRLAATGVMPNLPAAWAAAVRARVHAGDPPSRIVNPYLAADGPLATKLREAALDQAIAGGDQYHSQERFVRDLYQTLWLGGEVEHAEEEIHGIRVRDVTAYRPLIELCFGMPTDQFARDGQTRWLARRMAIGRMPEAQRTERRHGEHNVDWHARMTPRLGELRRDVARIAADPELAPVIDTARMLHDLDTWPAQTATDFATLDRLRFALPAVVYISRYLAYVSGRNAG